MEGIDDSLTMAFLRSNFDIKLITLWNNHLDPDIHPYYAGSHHDFTRPGDQGNQTLPQLDFTIPAMRHFTMHHIPLHFTDSQKVITNEQLSSLRCWSCLGDNGSGMHTHLSLWKEGEPLFAGGGYAGLSEMALHAIGGLLRHAPSVLAFTNPTTNSYKRLVPGYEAPVNLAYSQRNRSAACRIPMYSSSPKAKRIEFRCPDPSCNPYLAFAALLMAAVDGIQNKIDPGEPLDQNIYDLSPEEAAEVPTTPGSLNDALTALERDHEFLLKGDVFTKDVVDTWVEYKRENEGDAFALRPHPYEFCMYYDI